MGCLVGLLDCQGKELKVDGLHGWFVRLSGKRADGLLDWFVWLSGKRVECGWAAWLVCETVREKSSGWMGCLVGWFVGCFVQTAECCCRRCRAGDPDCSGRGQCTRFGNQSICVCDAGFTGDDCSLLVCPGTPTCSAHGTVQAAVFFGLRQHAGTRWCWNDVLRLACD